MAEEQELFDGVLLEERPVPWRGLGGSALTHCILVPLVALAFDAQPPRKFTGPAIVVSPIFRYDVVSLKLPRELLKQQALPEKVEIREQRTIQRERPVEPPPAAGAKPLAPPSPAPPSPPEPAPAPQVAATPAPPTPEPAPIAVPLPPKASPKAFPSLPNRTPEKTEVVILQPPTVRTETAKLSEVALPTITMTSPLPPRPRRVLDVGAFQRQRTMPKIDQPGPLPEPPSAMASAVPIRPPDTGVVSPKLPTHAPPAPAQTISAPPGPVASTGGPVVPEPGNLAMSSSRSVPARDRVEVPSAIVLPRPGTGPGSGGPGAGAGTAGSGTERRPAAGQGVPGGTGAGPANARGAGTAPTGAGAGSGVSNGSAAGAGTGKSGTGAAAEGTGGGLGDGPPNVRIVHPSTGRHDVMIVHSGVEQILPEARGLLEGDPVYTVYLNVGWKRDWILHYCIPREGPAGQRQVGGVVMLGEPEVVRAPYPLTTEVPAQALIPPALPSPIPGMTRKRPPVLLHGYLDEKGALTQMKLRGADEAGFGARVLKALANWDMRPATRQDKPTRVQVILVVPLH